MLRSQQGMLRSAWLSLWLSSALAENEHRVTLLASSHVRGAAFPTNRWGAECDAETYNSTPCDCYGGAARRQTYLSSGRQNAGTISIDLNSYFFGSGLFFPCFQGNASAEFFASVTTLRSPHSMHQAPCTTHRAPSNTHHTLLTTLYAPLTACYVGWL